MKTQLTNGINEQLVGLRRDMQEIKESMKELRDTFQNFEAGRLTKLEVDFAKLQSSFAPVQRVVYGIISVVLLTVLGALVMLVVQ